MASLPNFNDLPKLKQALPKFDSLAKKSKSDSVTAAIDKQKTVGVQYGQDKPVAQVDAKPQYQKKAPKPKVQPRPKKAHQLLTLRKNAISVGHALFYRYLRNPDTKNFGQPGPKGGACVLVNMLNTTSFRVSFSVCSEEDAFIKDEARRIAQERFLKGETILVANRDPHLSCMENISVALEKYIDKVPSETLGAKLQISSPAVNLNKLLPLLRALKHWSTTGD